SIDEVKGVLVDYSDAETSIIQAFKNFKMVSICKRELLGKGAANPFLAFPLLLLVLVTKIPGLRPFFLLLTALLRRFQGSAPFFCCLRHYYEDSRAPPLFFCCLQLYYEDSRALPLFKFQNAISNMP